SGRADPTKGHRAAGVGARIFDLTVPANRAKLEPIQQLTQLAAEAGMPLTHLATAFVRSHPAVTSVLIGQRKPERLDASLAGAVDDPRCYPGQIPGYSYLLVRDAVYPLEAGSARRLAPLEHRHAVLFYGSNAAPAQLARKYANSSVEVVVPAVLGIAHGLDVV